MKILCVSDIVMPQLESAANLRRHYNDIEVVVSCGDMPPVYLEFITSVLNVPLLYVRGNHDERYTQSPPGGIDLHNKIIEHKGLTFAGLEGCINYNNGEIQYTEFEMGMLVRRMWPKLKFGKMRYGRELDFLIAHSPIHGIHDLPDRPHQGMKALTKFLKWYKPRYMLHGHVHTYDRRKQTRTRFDKTCIINVNPITILEIEPGSECHDCPEETAE